jgi:Mn2+/Fe2+ NRAMP family transporter
MSEATAATPKGISIWRLVTSIGPAIIVASVVLGPGSILSNSKVGATFGYDMIWLLALATLMMVLTVYLAAILGIHYTYSPLTEISNRLGRPLAMLIGFVFFLITTCFQFTNNLAIIDAMNIAAEGILSSSQRQMISLLMILLINLGLVWVLYGSSAPYGVIEKMMMFMVGCMLIGFVVNLLIVQPPVGKVLQGFIPTLPSSLKSTDQYMMLLGLIGTTYSIAGAFYQMYAVREKKWTRDNLADGLLDSIVGIAVLGGISFVIMVTSATVLQGGTVISIADVAKQLEPLIGSQSRFMFCLGLSAAALSSLLVNALIGGTTLSDGLGLSANVKDSPVKFLTTLGLGIGMIVAMVINWYQLSSVMLIVSAQALTVIGVPLIAFAFLYLAFHLPASKLKIFACIIAICVMLISIFLAGGMILSIIQKLKI